MAYDTHPFLTQVSANLDDIAVDAVVQLLAEGGVEQISMAAVARWDRVSPAAIHQRHGGRQQFVDVVVGRFSWRWIRWVARPPLRSVVPVRLPENEDEALGVRAWELMRALAEGEQRAGRPACAQHVRRAVAEEHDVVRARLAQDLGHEPTPGQVEVLQLLADGLRRRVCDLQDPMPHATAHGLLLDHVAATFGLSPGRDDQALIGRAFADAEPACSADLSYS